MLEIFGKTYYIDIDKITEKCRLEKETKSESGEEEDTTTINIFKYEILKICLERVLTEDGEIDESIGMFNTSNVSLSFKIAFNTLINNDIIIEKDYE